MLKLFQRKDVTHLFEIDRPATIKNLDRMVRKYNMLHKNVSKEKWTKIHAGIHRTMSSIIWRFDFKVEKRFLMKNYYFSAPNRMYLINETFSHSSTIHRHIRALKKTGFIRSYVVDPITHEIRITVHSELCTMKKKLQITN